MTAVRNVHVMRVCQLRRKSVWVRRRVRDIDSDNAGAKVPSKEGTFFNVAETNGPQYKSTHVSGNGRSTGRASLKSTPRRKPGYLSLFARDAPSLALLLLLLLLGTRGTSISYDSSFLERTYRDAHYQNCFTRCLGGSTFIYYRGRHYYWERPSMDGMSEIWLSKCPPFAFRRNCNFNPVIPGIPGRICTAI